MANSSADSPFTGFGIGSFSRTAAGSVYLLVTYRDGTVAASAYATERGAMAAGTEMLDEERRDDEDEERGTLEDRFARAQQIVVDEGGQMEIMDSPVYGA